MPTIKKVVVSGAKRNLGPTAVQAPPNSGFTISVLTRNSSTPRCVISTIGVMATLIQTKAIDAAIANGIKGFIPSAFAFNTPDLTKMERTLPELAMRLKNKTVVIDYLVKKAATHPDFAWTAVGSGPLFNWTLKTGFIGTSIVTQTTTIVDSGNEPYITTTRAQIGRTIVGILQHPQETANKYFFITSRVTTQNKVLDALESATRSKWQVNRVTTQQ